MGFDVNSAISYFVKEMPGFFRRYAWHSLLFKHFSGPNTTGRGLSDMAGVGRKKKKNDISLFCPLCQG